MCCKMRCMDGGFMALERPETPVGAVVDVESRRRVLDERIGLLSAQIHALEAELVGTLAEFDEAGGWQGQGWRSFAHFVSVRTKFAPSDAKRLVSVAGRVGDLPSLLADARAGQVSVGLLASAARVVTPGNEEKVAEVVRVCTPAQAQRVLAAYRSVRPSDTADPVDAGEVADDPELDLWWRNWIDERGRYRIDGALDKLTGELLEQARRAAVAEMERSPSAGPSPSAETQGDPEPSGDADSGDAGSGDVRAQKRWPTAVESIAAMASTVLEYASGAGLGDRGGERFAVQVVCDIETLAAVLGIDLDWNLPVGLGARAYLSRTGTHLSDAELARVICEGTLQVLIEHAGQPLWLGSEKRLFNRHQRRALRHRAGGGEAACEFPGCPITRFVETHHIDGVAAEDGPTDLPNGALLCSFHHHELHRRGWRVVRNGTQLSFYDGNRCLGSSGPPGPTPGPQADVAVLPFQAYPPAPPPGIGPDSCRSEGGGERLTPYGLDVLLHHLLDAA